MYFIQNRLFSDSVRVVQFRQALVDLLTRIVLESIFKVTSKSYSNTFLSYTYYSNKSTIRLDFMCYLWRKSSNFFFFHLSSASVTKYPPVLVLSRLHLHFLWNTVVHLPIDYFTSTSQVDKKKKTLPIQQPLHTDTFWALFNVHNLFIAKELKYYLMNQKHSSIG